MRAHMLVILTYVPIKVGLGYSCRECNDMLSEPPDVQRRCHNDWMYQRSRGKNPRLQCKVRVKVVLNKSSRE